MYIAYASEDNEYFSVVYCSSSCVEHMKNILICNGYEIKDNSSEIYNSFHEYAIGRSDASEYLYNNVRYVLMIVLYSASIESAYFFDMIYLCADSYIIGMNSFDVFKFKK